MRMSFVISRWLRNAADHLESRPDSIGSDTRQMGDETVKYVAELANDSFKRQVDLDESVWRSLPFFAATFAFVATITGRATSDVPALTTTWFSFITNGLLILSIGCLGWTLRWFWVVLRRREYEYPADDSEVRQYAEDMTAYHAALGQTGLELDTKVVEEMRLFMIDQYGSAARTNLRLNATRLEARSKVLLFILIGFVLAFGCEATIFIHNAIYGVSEVNGGKEPGRDAERDASQQRSREQRTRTQGH
jgi:hypothetical protein